MDTPDPSAPARPTLAFIYDRCSTVATAALEVRIERCRRYAVEHGWVLAGEWVDRGDHALSCDRRPQWDGMTYVIRQAAAPAVCLVESWDRISREQTARTILQLAVHQARGYCVTAAGEDDRDLGHGRITVAAPVALRGRP
ncbi:hypothetical protein GCM10010400_40200 [Streptomyces aculeolatus]|uniref:recombinase family protein n=1 Tax=Streptomyces aculeolatus TaxID=270689 RepID=UPI001CECAD1B|nr:recombinase family protein [Streptomyces aculeolatus]